MNSQLAKSILATATDTEVLEFLMENLTHDQKKQLRKTMDKESQKEMKLLEKLEDELNPSKNYNYVELACALTDVSDYYNLGKTGETFVEIFVMKHEGRYY